MGDSPQQNSLQKMRVMVFGFHSKMMTEVIQELRSRSIEVVYWTAGKHDFMSTVFGRSDLFPGTFFHNTNDAILGIPAEGVDTSCFVPLGEALIQKFRECEVRSLIMMESIDRTEVPLMKKTHLYHTYLKYWYGVFTTLKPDAVLFYDVPHLSFKYVAYCVAKYLGVKQLILRNARISGRVFITDDFTDYKNLREKLESYRDRRFTLADLSPDVKDHYEKKRNTEKSPFFFRKEYTDKKAHGLSRFLPRAEAVFKNARNGTLLKTTYHYLLMLFLKNDVPSLEKLKTPVWKLKLQEKRWHEIKGEFKNEYLRHHVAPDYSKKYVYVPLQRQPERSTLSEGGVFIDQILMIDILSHALPKDWVIYVKENYTQWILPRTHVGRFRGYTQEIVEKKNVRVIPADTSTFRLTENAQAVATVTGTVAWEAAVRGKPALVFGYMCFMYCDGVFRVHDAASAKTAFEKIQAGYLPDQQKIVNFLKAFEETTVRGYLDVRFRDKDDANITFIKNDEENTKSISEGFYKELMRNRQIRAR